MNLQWESLIRAIVPLSFMAIWAMTSLFNREGRPKPVAGRLGPPRPNPITPGARPIQPTLRWNAPGGGMAGRPAPPQRPSRGDDDEGIVILSTDNRRSERDLARSSSNPGGKRPSKGKPVVPPRRGEPAAARARLGGVTQNVNQHLTQASIGMAPLEALPPVAAIAPLGQGLAPARATDSASLAPRSATARALADPARLREAFILNEILQPPVSIRDRPTRR